MQFFFVAFVFIRFSYVSIHLNRFKQLLYCLKKATIASNIAIGSSALRIDSTETANKSTEKRTHGMFIYTQNYTIFISMMTCRVRCMKCMHKSFVVLLLLCQERKEKQFLQCRKSYRNALVAFRINYNFEFKSVVVQIQENTSLNSKSNVLHKFDSLEHED